jgi:microcystin-dependent protein
MSDPYLAQIQIFPYNFAPRSWAYCNGQLLSIGQMTALFSLLGTTFGGDGRVTFGLPNLQTRVPLGQGQGPGLSPYVIGEAAGVQSVTLTKQEIASHSHSFNVAGRRATERQPPAQLFAVGDAIGMYTSQTGPTATFSPQAAGIVGNSSPHNNMQPFLSLNYCIALEGVYPKRPIEATWEAEAPQEATAKKPARARKPAARKPAARKPAAKKPTTSARAKKS